MSELYNLPDEWEWKKLGDLTTTTSGGTPKRNEKLYWGGNIGWLKSGELNDGYITNVEEYITKEGLTKSSAKLFSKGTLLIAMYGATVGKLGILEIETTTNQAICGILNDKNKFETLFMFYYLKKIREKMIEDSFGGAQPNLSQTYIKDLDIPLPPLEEQKRIVAKLDNLFAKIDKAITLHQKNIDEADIFMASVLNDVFIELEEKYPLKKVSDGLKNILTGTTPPTKEEKYYNEPSINWYSPSDFGKSKVLSLSKNMINSIALTDKKAKIYEKNTLLLVAIGATVGKIGVIKEEASSNQQITAMKFKDDIDVDFSYYWFYYIKQIIINTASAATLPIINQSAIKDLKFIIPPLQTQQKVVSYLDEISNKMEKIKNLQKKKMQSLKELKASILDKAFKGEL